MWSRDKMVRPGRSDHLISAEGVPTDQSRGTSLESYSYFCNMHVDHLIIGQGICGTFLSWYLKKAHRSFLIIDEARQNTASRVAAGIVNPVTGRRIVKTWMIDELMPFAQNAYEELGGELGIKAIEQKNIIDFFPTPQMKLAFQQRYAEDQQYISIPFEQAQWRDHFNDDFGFGEISPCLLVNISDILSTYRFRLKQELRDETFDFNLLSTTKDNIQYKDITASSIIFCDGVASAINPYFHLLPFAPNKGEVLWIECKGLPSSNIFKYGINLVPWKENIFWVGSSYEWEFQNDLPTEAFREKTIYHLKRWLKIPFTVIDHKASVRPATIERRPFIGFHPFHKTVGIFNGMGTKGCSLSPFFARQFVESIMYNLPIQSDVDILRFKNILSKSNLPMK
jgi:glycine/D-amino acid oxidase-like deaminating enzyme